MLTEAFEMIVLDDEEQDRIKQIVSLHADSLDAVNLALESAGVAEATNALRSAWDKVER